MSVWFRWDGFADLIEQFRTLATDLTNVAAPDVEAAAERAKATIYDGYPDRTGDLREHLGVVVQRTPTQTKAIVGNSSPISHIFENGTQARHTAIGANRGSMPPNPIFTQTVIRERRRLFDATVPGILVQFGLQVIGRA